MNIFLKILFPSTGFISQEPYNPAAKHHKHYSPQKRKQLRNNLTRRRRSPIEWWFKYMLTPGRLPRKHPMCFMEIIQFKKEEKKPLKLLIYIFGKEGLETAASAIIRIDYTELIHFNSMVYRAYLYINANNIMILILFLILKIIYFEKCIEKTIRLNRLFWIEILWTRVHTDDGDGFPCK